MMFRQYEKGFGNLRQRKKHFIKRLHFLGRFLWLERKADLHILKIIRKEGCLWASLQK